MRATIVRLLGLAAFVAAARAAWLHHLDNQAVVRTDAIRDAFAAGQAAERTRAAEEAATARRARYVSGAGLATPAEADQVAKEWLDSLDHPERSMPAAPWSDGWSTTYDPGPPPTLTVLPPGVEEPDFVERDLGPTDPDQHGGTSR